MLIKAGRIQCIKLSVISVAVLLLAMTLLTFLLSTTNESKPVGVEFRVNTTTSYWQEEPSAAMHPNGNFVIAWCGDGPGDTYGIFMQRYDSNGNPLGAETRVNTYTTGNQYAPSVAMDLTGNFVVCWDGEGAGDSHGVFAQRFDALGNPQGTEFRVNTYTANTQDFPRIAMNSTGNFTIAWVSDGQDGNSYGIFAQRFNSSGSPVGPEFKVNTYTTGIQTAPDVAMNSTGYFVIVWDGSGLDDTGVFAQRYDSNGNTLGGNFRVNTYTNDYQRNPSIAMHSTGRFVIAWLSNGQDGSGGGIYAQRFDSNGNKMGGEFQVNTYTPNTQNFPSIAMNSAGDFVITWASNGQDGSSYGIYAQHFDSNGNSLGDEFRVNTYIANQQNYPSAAMDSAGNYVITWESQNQDGHYDGVYAQRFDNIIPICVSDIQLLEITDSTATVTWKSCILGNSTVEYGFSTAYGTTIQNNSEVRLHSINLTGLEPGRLYHFRVTSYNTSTNYNSSGDFTFTTKFPIELEPGWNIISLPLNQTYTDLGIVLENISGYYNAVQWYNITDTIDPWKHSHTGKPQSMNDLREVDRFKGLWIHMKNATTLYVNGTAPEAGFVNQVTLYKGWNYVGYPSLLERAPGSSGLPAEVDMVQWFNASSGLWERWDPGSYSSDNLKLLRPGQGLWIHYTGVTDVWALEYVN